MARPRPVPFGFVVKKGSKRRGRLASAIPTPVSWTAISTVPASVRVRTRARSSPPSGIARGLDRTLREIPGDSDRGGRPVGEEEEDLLDDVDQIGLDPNDALGSR